LASESFRHDYPYPPVPYPDRLRLSRIVAWEECPM